MNLFKKNKSKIFILIGLSTLVTIFSFQNCSRNFNISSAEKPSDGDPELQNKPYKVKEMTKIFTVKPSGAELDILVVMDNSASMTKEQSDMSDRMNEFINKLGDKLDYQIGVITTDVSSNDPKKDGRFLKLQGLENEYILKSKIHTKDQMTHVFQDTIKMPLISGQLEQGMFATWRAIERAFDPKNLTINKPNRDFFRQNASLDVILVSDADESRPNPDQTDFIKSAQDLLDRVSKRFPSKPFRFHSIIVKPGDLDCKKMTNEAEGVLYAALSNLTQGIIGSVCEDNYSNQLSEIGQRVINSTRQFQLDCEAVPSSAEQETIDATVEGPVEFNTNVIEFKGKDVISSEDFPPGEYTVKYFCKDESE